MKMQKLAPILWTKDLQATIALYEDVLGFSSRSNFPNFASLTRDNVEIMVIVPTLEPDECRSNNDENAFFAKPKLTGSLFIFMDNVDELWNKVKDKATIKTSIADRDYMMRDFSILDNNGYEVVFGEDITERTQGG